MSEVLVEKAETLDRLCDDVSDTETLIDAQDWEKATAEKELDSYLDVEETETLLDYKQYINEDDEAYTGDSYCNNDGGEDIAEGDDVGNSEEANSKDEYCSCNDLVTYILFLLLTIAMDHAVAPDSLLCGILFSFLAGFFITIRSYLNARIFSLVSIYNGFGIAVIGALNTMELNDELVELFASQKFSLEYFLVVEMKLRKIYLLHASLMLIFICLLGLEFLLLSHEDLLAGPARKKKMAAIQMV